MSVCEPSLSAGQVVGQVVQVEALSNSHWKVTLGDSFELNVKAGVATFVGFEGFVTMVVVGLVVSTVQFQVAAVKSVFPPVTVDCT